MSPPLSIFTPHAWLGFTLTTPHVRPLSLNSWCVLDCSALKSLRSFESLTAESAAKHADLDGFMPRLEALRTQFKVITSLLGVPHLTPPEGGNLPGSSTGAVTGTGGSGGSGGGGDGDNGEPGSTEIAGAATEDDSGGGGVLRPRPRRKDRLSF